MAVTGEDKLSGQEEIIQNQALTFTQAVTVLYAKGQARHVSLQQWVGPQLTCAKMDIFQAQLPFKTLVFPFCEGLVLFRLKGKTGHKLLRNSGGLSKAQIGSQGKIKLQLLYGKANGKERLLPEKREPLPKGVGMGWGETSLSLQKLLFSYPGTFRSILGLVMMTQKTHLASLEQVVGRSGLAKGITFGSKILVFGLFLL